MIKRISLDITNDECVTPTRIILSKKLGTKMPKRNYVTVNLRKLLLNLREASSLDSVHHGPSNYHNGTLICIKSFPLDITHKTINDARLKEF